MRYILLVLFFISHFALAGGLDKVYLTRLRADVYIHTNFHMFGRYKFPRHKILFGGCIIKPLSAKGLGNIKDANLKEWPRLVKRIIKRYPRVQIVVPGHCRHGGKVLLFHTLKLLKGK